MINDLLLFTYTLAIILLAFSTLFILLLVIIHLALTYQSYFFVVVGLWLMWLGYEN